jgi:hypothetical protein
MKTRLEHLTYILILSPFAPLAGIMGGWFLAFSLLPEKWIPYGTLTGLLLGILADIFIIKGLIKRKYDLSLLFWAMVMLFYAIGLFGIFMGVPIFHVGLAIPIGFLVGSRLAHRAAGKKESRTAERQALIFSTGLLTLICLASATIALSSSSTPFDIQGMLGLPFQITPLMLWGIILIGGASLLVINSFLTIVIVRFTYHFLSMSTSTP